LIRFWNFTRDEGFLHVKARRPVTSPNPGFWDQLKVFEDKCRNTSIDETLPASQHHSFDENWARKSNATFVTYKEIPELVENDEYIHCLASVDRQTLRDHVLFTCLDFVWGRGVHIVDLEWLAFVCESLDRKQSFSPKERAAVAIKSMIEDPESEFCSVWSGEIYKDQSQNLLRKLKV
jgi:hypothetical protein